MPTWACFGSWFGPADWTHFALTYDGTDVKLYKNGAVTASFISTAELPSGAVTRFLTSNDATWDELALYDRPLRSPR